MTSALPQIGVSVKGYVYYHGNAPPPPSCGELPLGLVGPWKARVSKTNSLFLHCYPTGNPPLQDA